jgi:hypothetical protein
MDHRVAAGKRLFDRGRMAEVADDLDEPGISPHLVEHIEPVEIKIEHRDGVAEREQSRHQHAADVSGAARYENVSGHGHRTSSFIWTARAAWRAGVDRRRRAGWPPRSRRTPTCPLQAGLPSFGNRQRRDASHHLRSVVT